MTRQQAIPHSKPTLGATESRALSAVMRSGQIAQGPIVERFEKEMAAWMHTRGAVAVSSGTAALHLGLLAMGIGKGDEILLPSYVCTALLNAILYTGATPRLVDIDPDSMNVRPLAVKKAISRRTKAVIVPHLFGMPADMHALKALKIPIIEACAQSLGARYRGKWVGTFGIFSFVSFYATKLITTGEGGMVLSRSRQLLNRVRTLRQYDQRDRHGLSFNYKMTDLQAAMGRIQLKRLPSFLAKRKALSKRYHKALAPLPIQLPAEPADRERQHYRYVIKVKGRVELYLERFQRAGINCRRPVYYPLHRYLGQTGFSQTDRVYRQALSLPLYPSLLESEVRSILSTAIRVLK